MKRILVLGAGLVGSAIIRDLLLDQEFHLTVVDKTLERLKGLETSPLLKAHQADISQLEELNHYFGDVDVVLNAMPGYLGFDVVKAAIIAGKDVVDIAFSPEDPLLLDSLAREKGCKVIVDMGVAPGMSNVLTGHAASLMDEVDALKIVVGGLPQIRNWPFEYKAVFSPVDVLEEYTRPARFIINHEIVVRPALSDQELLDLPGIGTLEAFNSDGLRSLLHTIPARNMVEKTLRYPGHARLMEVFKHTGFFEAEPLLIQGQKVSPMALTAALLFEQWKLHEGEGDLTVMQVKAFGTKDNKPVSYQADLFDRFDEATGIHSMARTTGYAATAALRLLSTGTITQQGVILPEFLGRNASYREFLLMDQSKRGIHYHISIG